MKDFVVEFQNKLAEIDKEISKFYIMNAGSMNHGKSSLFNSLLNREEFAAQDVRTTITNKSVLWQDNIYLVDTPGFAAETSDDTMAYEAYRKANMIIFVHTAKVGELHKKELEAINNIKSIFNDEKFFWQHFCLVITFMDSDSNESITAIINKSLEDIKNFCHGYNFQTFVVSNSRYKKGRAENKQVLISRSGILELRDYLQKNFVKWLSESKLVRKEKIKRAKTEILSQLEHEKSRVKNSSNQKISQIKNWQKNFLYKLESAITQYKSDEQEINYKESRLNDLQYELSELQDRWNREHY